jgi:tol-pal system protein YbgF
MLRKITTLVLIITVVAMFSGCASRKQLGKMEQQLDYLVKSNAEIKDKVDRLDSLYQAQEETQVSFLANLRMSISAFDERLEQLGYQLADLSDRMGKIEMINVRPLATEVVADSITEDTTVQTSRTEVDPAVIFNSAFKSLTAGNYEIAVLGFTEYLTSFPNTELTDDAQFWLGECYYQTDPRDYQKAKTEFAKIVKDYPKSNRMAGALFKMARCNEELKNTQEAIKLYRDILTKYPQSAEANRSKVQLAGLGEQ